MHACLIDKVTYEPTHSFQAHRLRRSVVTRRFGENLMGTESGSASSIVAELGAPAPFSGGVHLHGEAGHSRPLGRERLRHGSARRQSTPQLQTHSPHAHWHDRVLPAPEFDASLHRETRRAERSGTPLSLVLFSVEAVAADELLHFERLLAVLQCSKRETDIRGW
jgi:hypothetical protein